MPLWSYSFTLHMCDIYLFPHHTHTWHLISPSVLVHMNPPSMTPYGPISKSLFYLKHPTPVLIHVLYDHILPHVPKSPHVLHVPNATISNHHRFPDQYTWAQLEICTSHQWIFDQWKHDTHELQPVRSYPWDPTICSIWFKSIICSWMSQHLSKVRWHIQPWGYPCTPSSKPTAVAANAKIFIPTPIPSTEYSTEPKSENEQEIESPINCFLSLAPPSPSIATLDRPTLTPQTSPKASIIDLGRREEDNIFFTCEEL